MRLDILVASAAMMLFCASVLGASAKLSPADETAAFKPAAFKRWNGQKYVLQRHQYEESPAAANSQPCFASYAA
jgi:hypothetical protein